MTFEQKRKYIILMAICVAMNEGLMLLSGDLPVWLDCTGTAMAAFLLEPAAGLIVGLINNFFLSIFQTGAPTLIYYSISAAVAIIVGVYLKAGKITLWRIIKTMALVIGISTLLSIVLTVWNSNGVPNTAWERSVWMRLQDKGFSEHTALCFEILITKIYDTILSAIIIAPFCFVLPKLWKKCEKIK